MLQHIGKRQRGLVFQHGDYVRMLTPGWHLLMPYRGFQVAIYDVLTAFQPEGHLDLYLRDPRLAGELVVIEVADAELALHFKDGRFAGVLETGRHAFWKAVEKHEFRKFDKSLPEIGADIDRAVLDRPAVKIRTAVYEVAQYETGLLFYDGVFVKELRPGTYRFWKGPTNVTVQTVDRRTQQLDMTGQEVMTRDKVSLRLNFMLQFRIVDAVQVVTAIKDFAGQLYILLQLVLREYVGGLELDELLQKKEEINRFVLDRLRSESERMGVEFLYAGVKDVVLPGEIREILNLVLVAQKKAQANVITRREETASARSLLNTARLMDENPTLYRMKELEALERIAEKIGTISLMGGGTLLEHLNGILAQPRAGPQA